MENRILKPYSVLMSVYKGENTEYFRASMDSLCNQTHPASQIVLVCDGPLGDELDMIVSEYKDKLGDILDVVQLPENKGTAYCANIGLKSCKNEYIMKMDSDDVCKSNRAEKQMSYLTDKPYIDILGSYIEEFKSADNTVIGVRQTPTTHEEIVKFAKRRAPFNNQTLVYKKEYAEKIGGYSSDLIRCEDYDFMVRMLMAGAKSANIPEVLVRYRVDKNNLKRRRNWKNTKSFFAVRKKIYKMGFSGFWDYVLPCAGQLLLFITPSCITGLIYKLMLRK
ncbi:MAG: glycosyltransferase [Ruminiclostridium sp.]|nr:glycosyltransferase [Ruminiclostridium sp.]